MNQMPGDTAIGIILQIQPLTETSLIVQWLTADFGRLTTVARGARRPRSPFLGKLDLFYEAAFSFSRSRKSDLHTLRELSLRQLHLELRTDLLRLHQAAYAASFIRQVTEADTPLPAFFDLFQSFLNALCAHPPSAQIIFSLELKLLRELGLHPDWSGTSLSAGSKKIAGHLLDRGFASVDNLKLTVAQLGEIRQFLHGYLIFHLGRLPKGRATALNIPK